MDELKAIARTIAEPARCLCAHRVQVGRTPSVEAHGVENSAVQTPRETDARSPGDELPFDRSLAPEAFAPEALLPGSRLDEFEIERVLGAGGFGIVYLALDQVLLRYVAIKEFIPTALARRTPQGAVVARSVQAAQTFGIGLDSFYNEGRLLARFDNPSLVRVFRLWKANGTAYMAMQYCPGQTLKEARRQMPAPPDEAWLRLFVDRLLGALETLHAEGVYHRDIAPDNILLLPDGQPVILDFGSARRVLNDRTQSLTAILKPNYSPVEQYADDAGMRQGAYTDLYALGGTVYFMLTGKEPIPAVMRAVRDSFPLLAQNPGEPFASVSPGSAISAVSRQFLSVIDWLLAVSPDDRPQTVAETRAALRGEVVPPPPTERHGVVIGDPNLPYDTARATAKTEVAATRSATPRRADVPISGAAAAAPVGTPPGRRSTWVAASGLGMAACAALAWAMWGAPAHSSAEPLTPPLTAARTVPASAPPLAAVPAIAVESTQPAVREAAQRESASPASVPAPPHRVVSRPPAPPPPKPPAAAAAGAAAISPVVAPRNASAAALCANMNLFARAACLSRACDTPQWKSHLQCIEARRIADQRQRRMEQ